MKLAYGADDSNRQMVDILNAVLTDGLPAMEVACAEAIAHGVHSADVMLNILARQRDPPTIRLDQNRRLVWTKIADEILNSLARYIQRISGAGH